MNARQKAKDLVEMVCDENGNEKERLTAAIQLAKLIKKHDLLASPLDLLGGENETVQAAKSILETLTDPKLAKNVKKVADGFRRR